MELSLDIALLVFFVAMIAAWVDVIAGGGGLLTLPVLILAGLPPAAALATNKLQGSAGTLTASIYFIRQGTVNLKAIKWLIIATFIGSVTGSWLILQINPDQLMIYLPILLILMGLYFLFSPNIGDKDRKEKLTLTAFALLICPLLGFYDGFFGPGTGSFMALAIVLLLGYNLTKATAHSKILNFTSNIASLLYFIVFGDIYWAIGAVMIAGQTIGATIGAKMVLTKGASLIRPVVVAVCFLMSLNILFRSNF